MQDKNIHYRAVFFVSDSTGITVETLGRSLLLQFSTIHFESYFLRFIDTEGKALEAVTAINQVANESGHHPIIISSLVKPELREIVAKAQGLYLDVFDTFIAPLEQELGAHAILDMGRAHGVLDDAGYNKRMDAVNYSLNTDDGIGVKKYFQADVILTGVSRTGKTPTSLYLAMHYGINAANYPIVDDDINKSSLPSGLKEVKDKVFGLLVSPERLQNIRKKRRPDGQYASLSQCQHEIRQSEVMFQNEDIPYLDVTTMSIEEISSSIMNLFNLSTKSFPP